jgi:anti-sigma factor RsiW
MACDRWSVKLDTYLDGELSSEEMRSVDAHVRSCASCAADALARVQMKGLVRASGKSFAASPEFRARVLSRKPKRRLMWTWAFAGISLVLLIALSITYVGQQRSRRAQIFSELADLHVATLASANPVDIVSTDRHTVKPWFEGKIPFTFNLPELQNSDFSLLGGRICYLEQTPGAQLIYRLRKHQISVFIFQDRALPVSLTGSFGNPQLSFSNETWIQEGLRFFVVGDTGAADNERLSELLKAAQKP